MSRGGKSIGLVEEEGLVAFTGILLSDFTSQ